MNYNDYVTKTMAMVVKGIKDLSREKTPNFPDRVKHTYKPPMTEVEKKEQEFMLLTDPTEWDIEPSRMEE